MTEPYIAHVILEALNCGSAIFVGNSMPIRDADMYGSNWTYCTHSNGILLSSGLPCYGIQVSGNRGASGIDGLFSTAVGFAVGCNKRVSSSTLLKRLVTCPSKMLYILDTWQYIGSYF